MPDSPRGLPRTIAIVAALLAGGTIFVRVVHQSYAVNEWLIWIYAAMWVLCAGWALSCLAAGHLLLSRALRMRLPLREHLVMAFATGVLLFGVGLFVAGLFGLLTPLFFYGWPLVLLASGGGPLWIDARELLTRLRRRSLPGAGVRLSWPHAVAILFGVGGIVLLYLQILTPANVSYDSRWYHLGLAEHYVMEGAIARFPEGWFQGTLPQLASWLYTWAMLAPRTSLFFHIELAAHLEFTLFLATLACVPVLVRRLTGRRGHRGSWAAVFLFPGIFLYDSNLNVGADHVLAFWAIPVALAVAHVEYGKGRKGGILLGIALAGALLTKYQAVYLLAGAASLLLFGSVLSWARRPSNLVKRAWRMLRERVPALILAGLVVLVLTSPHWLKNWIWYDNPLYPFMHGLFGGEPWAEGVRVGIEDPGWRPTGTFFEKVTETLGTVFTFSFVPHDWAAFHRNVPVFGSLFTLLLLPLVFLRGTRRIWNLVLATLVAVFVWYWTYHQDRYLQALVPYMAAMTAATLVLLWRTRVVVVRLATCALVALQIAWGGDVPFFPTHVVYRDTPYRATLRILSTGFREARAERYKTYSALPNLRPSLRPSETFLIHENHLRLGLRRRLVTDSWGRQGAIVYKSLGQPRAVYEKLRSLNVTQVVWLEAPSSLQRMTDDLVFYEYIRQYADREAAGHYRISTLRERPPPAGDGNRQVTVLGCDRLLTLSWNRVDQDSRLAGFRKCGRAPVSLARIEESVSKSGFLLVDDDLLGVQRSLKGRWLRLFERDGIVAFVPRSR